MLALLVACNAPPSGSVEAPELRALGGEGFSLLWADRALRPGERVEWQDTGGGWRVLGLEGVDWLLPSETASFRWVGPSGQVTVTPEAFALTLTAPQEPTVFLPGETIAMAADWAGPEIPFPVSLALRRPADGTWLNAQGAWSDQALSFAPDTAATGSAAPAWLADAGEPLYDEVEATLDLLGWGAVWRLARARAGVVQAGRALAWGDLHSHTNLSYDGCEVPDTECQPRGDWPALDHFAQAEAAGLDFAVMTDHAEFSAYIDLDSLETIDIWDETLRLAQEADGGSVLPLVGYEWTSTYGASGPDDEPTGGHRTVLFETLTPCETYVVGANSHGAFKVNWGHEDYLARATWEELPADQLAAMERAGTACGPERFLSWFHHPAYYPPRPAAWNDPDNLDLGDRVVEILSEHGCSECFDRSAADCQWQLNQDRYVPSGAVQLALQRGLHFGFLGGTDNHEGRPGSIADGPGPVAAYSDRDGDGVYEAYHIQYGPGAVTGALYAGPALTRPALLDAIEARTTLVASWIPLDVRVAALGQDGVVYLPGADVPAVASPLRLLVALDEPLAEEWQISVIDPWNEVWLESDQPTLDEPLDLNPGDIRYLRVRVWIDGEEQRLWASPFFGETEEP